ncbi:hypothetical protein [Flagellimonas meridianipacifica]|uniref:hypothetical protein n=1 Tax=Flagellimonas meridianipacifica TaxID=1080225 RepID=UPI000D049B3A|nr:hypothetical protein [Allomuricauda pacifica]
MNGILDFIAKQTDGYSYKSFKYCIDSIAVPQLQYDDKQDISATKRGETQILKSAVNLESLVKAEQARGRPIFKFFLDGSRRTYKVDDLAYGPRLYPAVAGQIGIACCERESKDDFKPVQFERSLVLSIPNSANPGSHQHFFSNLLKKLNQEEYLKKRGLQFSKILNYKEKDGDEYEKKAIATIQNEMVDQEKRLVGSLAQNKILSASGYLIKDGSLEYGKMPEMGEFGLLGKVKSNYKYVVGVSKAFNPESMAKTEPKISKSIAGLPLNHRTPVIKYTVDRVGQDVWFAVWYLRVRHIKYCHSPYDGVVKVEKILVSEKETE